MLEAFKIITNGQMEYRYLASTGALQLRLSGNRDYPAIKHRAAVKELRKNGFIVAPDQEVRDWTVIETTADGNDWYSRAIRSIEFFDGGLKTSERS